MKKFRVTRIICSIIAVLLLLSVFAACSDKNPDGDKESETTKQADVTTVPSGDPGDTEETPSDTTNPDGEFVKDNIPADLNFNGKTITLLYWSDREHEEFESAEPIGENVPDAIFERNLAIEERLGIDMQFISTPGDSHNINEWVNYVRNSIHAGGDSFDVMAGYSLSTAATAAAGLNYDLLDEECNYLDFDMPWWPTRLNSEATINDKLYFASGDISANALYMMYVCFVNNNIIEELNLPNVYKLVDNNEWTYDKFIEMCKDIYSDQNSDGIKSVGDRFGYLSGGIHIDPWFYGTGALIVDKDGEGNPRFAPSFASERTINALTKLNNFVWNTNDAMYTTKVYHQDEFNSGNLLFAVDRCRIAITKLVSEDLKFSVVPFPKYDAVQESFVTVVGNPFTLYAIPIDAKEEELPMLSAYLETYASESYRKVTPQLFEVTLKVRYTQSNEDARMYDIIRQNITFDLGRIFSNILIGQSTWRDAVANNSSSWAAMAKRYEKIMNTKLKHLIGAYEG